MKIENSRLRAVIMAACATTIAATAATVQRNGINSTPTATAADKRLDAVEHAAVANEATGGVYQIADTVITDTAEADTAYAGTDEADTTAADSCAAEAPRIPFAAHYSIQADAEDNNCSMDIDLFKKEARRTYLNATEETTASCYGVIFIGNAPGYQPDYCTITGAKVDGNHADITFTSCRDNGTYTAELVYNPDGAAITVHNVKLVKVAWSPNPQTMLKSGMVFHR